MVWMGVQAMIHSDKSSLFKAHTRDIVNVWNLFSHQAALFDSFNDLPDSCFNWFRVFVAGATQQHMFPCLFSSSTQSQWTADHFFPDREKKNEWIQWLKFSWFCTDIHNSQAVFYMFTVAEAKTCVNWTYERHTKSVCLWLRTTGIHLPWTWTNLLHGWHVQLLGLCPLLQLVPHVVLLCADTKDQLLVPFVLL